jgi:hypothetical protein
MEKGILKKGTIDNFLLFSNGGYFLWFLKPVKRVQRA